VYPLTTTTEDSAGWIRSDKSNRLKTLKKSTKTRVSRRRQQAVRAGVGELVRQANEATTDGIEEIIASYELRRRFWFGDDELEDFLANYPHQQE